MAVGAGRWNGRRLRRSLGVRCLAGMILMAGLAGCSDSNSFNQKLTLVVETPAGEVSGAAVVRVIKQTKSNFLAPPEARGAISALKGEAAFVEVAPGRYLFALLGGQDNLAQKVFARELRLDGIPAAHPEFEDWTRQLSQMRVSREVPPQLYPLLVTFGDIADPKTVRRVEPDNLAASFGPGARLRAITLEISDEKVTEGRVEGVLGWLGPHPEPGLCPATGRTDNIPFCRRVQHGDFLRR